MEFTRPGRDHRVSARRPALWRFGSTPSAFLLITAVFAVAARGDFQGATHLMPFEEETINYAQTPPSGSVARLREELENGKARLEYEPAQGYLLALLEHLGISPDSQMLVFSKTSFQRERISPQTPRALYFNDDAYVGFIPGAPMIEVSAVDPKLGAVFYTLDQSELAANGPRLVRTDQCLECHASSKSMGVPGHLVRSFVTQESGLVDLGTGISPVNHRTPLEDRWGGWYVSGTHGAQPHRGNLIGATAFERHKEEPDYLGNVTDLSRFFDVARYPSPHSDIVALMVLEHQTHLHNFITRLNYAATLSLRQYGHVKYLKSAIEAFLKYLLFTEEAPLTAPIKGTSEFARQFSELGPRDTQRRSLREFDLQTRMFKHPCSYLIYSEAFDNLPEPLRQEIYRRLWEILTGTDTSAAFSQIPSGSKEAILQILRETIHTLPEYWRKGGMADGG